MNIFNKVALQGMKKSPTRTIVTVIGVILSAAMITAVAAFAVSLQTYMVKGAMEKYGDWHVEFLDVNDAFVKEQAKDQEVKNTAAIENIGYAALKGGKNPEKPYLFVAGFSKEAFDTLPIDLLSGRMPENSGEVVLPAHVASNGGVKYEVGDTLSLAVGDREAGGKELGQHDPYAAGNEKNAVREHLETNDQRTYKIVGICERPAFEEFSSPGYTLITAADSAHPAGSLSVFVTLDNPKGTRDYAASAAGSHACVFNDDVLRFMGLSNDNLFNMLLYSVVGILVVMIMIGSIFLIYNSFNISLNERTRQFGILSSVGATARQLRNSVLFEGFCIGAVGIPIGVLAGIGSISLVISIISKNFASFAYSSVPLKLMVSVPAIIAAAVVSMITILISAYIPAKKAAGTPVMENIRQTNEVKVDPKAVKTSKLAQRLYGLEGTLALKNFKRNKGRYRSIVLSLTLSVVLFVSAGTFGSHLKQGAERSAVNSDYDICLYTQNGNDDELFGLYDQLRTAGGVYESSYQSILKYSCPAAAGDFSQGSQKAAGLDGTKETVDLSMDIQFIEDSIYLDFIKSLGLSPTEYTGENAKLIAAAKVKNDRQKQDEKNSLIDLFAKNSIDVRIAPEKDGKPQAKQGQDVSITFVDTIPSDTLPTDPSEVKPYVFIAVAPYQLKDRFDSAGVQNQMGLTFLSKNPAQSTAEMEKMIQGAGLASKYTLYNVHKIFEQNRSLLFVVNLFAYVFIIMISLIAIANVFNTISTNIRLRRRELAMLRSVGMSDRDFQKMMNFECAFYGMRTLLLGLPIAAVLSFLIYKVMAAGGLDLEFIFPWSSMGISIAGVFLVIFITMLYAISRIKKENIIDVLRDDMA